MARRSMEPIPSKTLTEDKTFVYAGPAVDTDEKKPAKKTVIKEEKVEEPKPVEKKVSKAKVVNCSQLAFRKGPGMDFPIIQPIAVGTEVSVIRKADDEWTKVIYDGREGFVMSKYIK